MQQKTWRQNPIGVQIHLLECLVLGVLGCLDGALQDFARQVAVTSRDLLEGSERLPIAECRVLQALVLPCVQKSALKLGM